MNNAISKHFDKTFAQAIFALLEGKFLCVVSDPVSYAYLQSETGFNRANEYLRQIGLEVSSLEDGVGYFANHLKFIENKGLLREELVRINNQFAPLLRFLAFCLDSLSSDSTVRAGEKFTLAELAYQANNNSKVSLDLNSLYSALRLNGSASTVSAKVRGIARHLEDHGYVVLHHEAREEYMFTAKLEYLKEQILFVKEYAQILDLAKAELVENKTDAKRAQASEGVAQ